MAEKIDKNFWENRYKDNKTGWDIGHVSTPLKEYVDQLKNKSIRILIPGCGNAYEAEYLFRNGFVNVYVADCVLEPLENLKKRIPEFPEEHLLNKDFFEITERFDLILEQTFFCALHPSLREKYARQMHQLLLPGGKLVGLLFDDALNKDEPPFGGTKEEYLGYFKPFFTVKVLDPCYNSIQPRAGRELFMVLQKTD